MSQQLRARFLEIDREIQAQGYNAERAGSTYSAHMSLYNVAAGTQDITAMENARLAMHTNLDVILDSGCLVAKLTRERDEIMLRLLHGN